MCILSYYRHRIGSVNHQPSIVEGYIVKNGRRCRSWHVLHLLHHPPPPFHPLLQLLLLLQYLSAPTPNLPHPTQHKPYPRVKGGLPFTHKNLSHEGPLNSAKQNSKNYRYRYLVVRNEWGLWASTFHFIQGDWCCLLMIVFGILNVAHSENMVDDWKYTQWYRHSTRLG